MASADTQRNPALRWFLAGTHAGVTQQRETSMENPTPELVTLRCPCSDPNPCYSQTISSPKGLITILFWECKGFTEEEKDEETTQLFQILMEAAQLSSDEDETS